MSRRIAGFQSTYFNVDILQGSEKYPGFLPPISPKASLVRDHIAFVKKKRADSARRYDRTMVDLLTALDLYQKQVTMGMRVVGPLLTDYDKEVVLPSTCALGIWPSACTDLDAQGSLGLDTDVTYPDHIIDALVDHYARFLPKSLADISLSMPRGKMIGFPYFVPGSSRSANDVFLALCAMLVTGAKKAGGQDSLASLYSFLKPHHGEAFAIEGFRQQHTAKEMPIILRDGIYSSTNFNPRYRIINMESKLSVLDIREDVKKMLYAIKGSPLHTQDRKEILERIDRRQKQGWLIVATDYSKFDFRHGGKRGHQQIDLHSRVLKSEAYKKSATLAFNTRFFTYGHKQVYQFPGDVMLKSGLGNTTLIGCTGNASATVAVLADIWRISGKEVMAKLGQEWDALEWGDDTVLMLKDTSLWDVISTTYKKFKLEVDQEETIKFLGSNYLAGGFKGSFDKGYSIGRAFQQQFFPERMKIYPFTTVGYIARLELMGPKGRDFHSVMLPFFESMDLGPPFKYDDRYAVLDKLGPEIAKKADKISQMDDILALFTHGIQDLSHDLVDMPPEFLKLLGLTSTIDLTDPIKFLASTDDADIKQLVSKDLLLKMKKITDGDFSQYKLILAELTHRSKLTWAQGSVIY